MSFWKKREAEDGFTPQPEPEVLKRRKKREYTKQDIYDLFHNIELFPKFCEEFLVIVPREGMTAVPFKLNKAQWYVFNRYIKDPYQRGEPIRIMCLKARQEGISTLTQALGFWSVLGHQHWAAKIIASKKEQSLTVFKMMKRFWRNLPNEPWFPTFMVSQMNRDNMEFVKPEERKYRYDPEKNPWTVNLDSHISIGSSEEDDDLGRAGTYQFVHASEVASWKRLHASLGSLLSCAQPTPQTVVLLESTAKGMNEFYDLWKDEEHAGRELESIWQKVFLPWYYDPRYEKELSSRTEKKFIDDYEEELFKRIKNDTELHEHVDQDVDDKRIWEKIFWRRWTIHNNPGFRIDPDYFNQEFPSTPTEAFRFTAQSVWNPRTIEKMEKHIRAPEWRGDLHVLFDRDDQHRKDHRGRKVSGLEKKLIPNERGRLKIFEKPKKDCFYVVTADVAEGKAVEGVSESLSKRDFSVVQVFKMAPFPPFEQVAVWHGSVAPHILGYIECALGEMYAGASKTGAYLAWENNSLGVGIQVPVIEHVGYQNVYMRREISSVSRHETHEPGWKTTSKTKYLAVHHGIMLADEGHLIIHDESTLMEMKSFSRVGENQERIRFEAARGHDDRVMAMLIAIAISEEMLVLLTKQAKGLPKEDGKSRDWRDTYGFVFPWDEEKNAGGNPYLGGDI